jgi:hypothetical protein
MVTMSKLICEDFKDEQIEPGTTVQNAGQVATADTEKVLDCGNFREQMTMFMNFQRDPVKFLWGLICMDQTMLPPCINVDVLHKHRELLMHVTGLHSIEQLKAIQYLDDFIPSRVVDLMRDGAVSLSRLGAFPNTIKLRTERKNEDQQKYALRVCDAIPKLSVREISFMTSQTGNTYESPKDLLPWTTGQMYWELNEKNFFAKLGKKYRHDMIAGPSGNTDMALTFFELMHGFDVRLATLACIGWMCPCKDHSPFEILLAAIPFGLNYDTTEDVVDYVKKLLEQPYNPTAPMKTPASPP